LTSVNQLDSSLNKIKNYKGTTHTDPVLRDLFCGSSQVQEENPESPTDISLSKKLDDFVYEATKTIHELNSLAYDTIQAWHNTAEYFGEESIEFDLPGHPKKGDGENSVYGAKKYAPEELFLLFDTFFQNLSEAIRQNQESQARLKRQETLKRNRTRVKSSKEDLSDKKASSSPTEPSSPK
jgi:hypothetical protein